MTRFIGIIATSVLLVAGNTHAQSTGFADDFSSNPFLYNIELDSTVSDDDGITIGSDGSSLNARATSSADERAKIQFNPNFRSGVSEVTINATLSSESQIAADGTLSIIMEGYFFNDIQEGGTGSDERTGDSRVTLIYQVNSDDSTAIFACFERRNEDGSKSPHPGADVNDGDPCTFVEASAEIDVEHTMTIGYDQASAVVYAVFDSVRTEYPITTGHFAAQDPSHEFQLRATGDGTVAVGNFSSVTTNLFAADDLSVYAEESRYADVGENDNVSIENGKIRISVVGTESGAVQTNRNFRALGDNDFVEAKIMLSSESTLEGEGSNLIRVRNYVYNEIQDGGIAEDDRSGEVFAAVNLFARQDGQVMADLSITRSDNENFSESTTLSNDPDDPFPLLANDLAYDTEYTASIQFDRASNQLVFKFEDAEYKYDIQSPTYKPGIGDGAGVGARIRGIGETIGFVDDFRTAPDALTDEELAATMSGTGGSTTDTGGSSGGGGGCSISGPGAKNDPLLLLLSLFSMLWLVVRLRKTKLKPLN